MRGFAPDVPDPTKIAGAGVEAIKAVAKGGVGVGIDIASGVEQILFNTIEGGIRSLQSGASDIASIIKRDVDLGKTTFDRARQEIERTCDNVLTQVDRAIGEEVVRKFKREVEKQIK